MFGLSNQQCNGIRFLVSRSGGPQVAFDIDNIRLETGDAPVVFTMAPLRGEVLYITEIRFGIADNVSGIVTVAGTTENHSMDNLSYDKILGVSALTNGIVFTRIQNGKTLFAVTLKQLGDFLSTGSNLINVISDGTNTFITLLVEFPEPIIIEGNSTENFLSFTISDNLSGLLVFTAAARGALEV